MYDPMEAKKTYLALLSEKGAISGLKSALFVIMWYLNNKYILRQEIPTLFLTVGFFIFSAYFTWKPKVIRYIRGVLRGPEYRDKAD